MKIQLILPMARDRELDFRAESSKYSLWLGILNCISFFFAKELDPIADIIING